MRSLDRKIQLFFWVGSAVFISVALKLFFIQVIDHDHWIQRAKKQHIVKRRIVRKRGTIYDRNGNVLAYTAAVKHLICDPLRVEDPEVTLKLLATFTRLQVLPLLEKLKKAKARNRRYLLLKNDVTMEEYHRIRERIQLEKEQLESRDSIGVLAGCVHFKDSTRRYYPYNMIAANVLGFVGRDGKGLEGTELHYDDILSSRDGLKIYERGLNGFVLPDSERILKKAEGGTSIYLSLDVVIQYIIEKALREAYDTHRPKSAVILVMDPHNGEVLGMASEPSFNPNYFPYYSASDFKNRAISDQFEPGSTYKVFTVAAALESNAITVHDLFGCMGFIEMFDVFRIHCDGRQKHGQISTSTILQKSCNVGAIQIAQRVGTRKLFDYFQRFGFGQLSGIQLPGETRGINRHPKRWSGLSIAAKSIGQEIAANAVQMTRAFSAIVNGGILYHPKIMMKTKRLEGQENEVMTRPVRRVISEKTSKIIMKMLKTVTEQGGSGRRASISGYDVLGKTGTAQSLAEMKKTSSEWVDGLNPKVVASFLGALPAEDPRLVIYVMLNEPQGEKYYGGQVAAPIFSSVGQKVLSYLKVVPSRQIGVDQSKTDSWVNLSPELNPETIRRESSQEASPPTIVPVSPSGSLPMAHREQIPEWLRVSDSFIQNQQIDSNWSQNRYPYRTKSTDMEIMPEDLVDMLTEDEGVIWE